ncbi:hypothetical protein CDAR_290121, partial [Caerostris darwini]
MSNVNEVNMEDSTPIVNNGPHVTPQNASRSRPVSPSGIHVSEEFAYDNIELISELHAFQSQLEHLHNCMQAASSSEKDVKLVAQTNALVQKVEELISSIGVPLGKLPATPAEAERIKAAVEERRNPQPSTSQPSQ